MRVFKWCKTCKIPLIQSTCGNFLREKEIKKPNQRIIKHDEVDFISRIKPVGKKEYQMYKKLFIQKKTEEDYSEKIKSELQARFPKILYRSRNYLYSEVSNGQAHFKLTLAQNDSEDAEWKLTNRILEIDDIYSQTRLIRSEFKFEEYFLENSEYRKKLINGNKQRLATLEKQAIKFIRRVVDRKRGRKVVASFSGGKDSAVTAYLCKKALDEITLIFSNTDIEFQETIDYVRLINEKYTKEMGDLVEVKSKNNFHDLCEKLGPPSRIMRWCCSTQKASPVNQYYSKLMTEIVSFDGIRREESNMRADYPREHQNTKLQQQYSAYPILDWTEIDVWLYTLWRMIPINPLYEEGFARVGCWACPNNGSFDTFLFEKIWPEKANTWYNQLERFADKISEEEDHNYGADWIWDSIWKGRRVKYHNQLIGDISHSDSVDFDIMEDDDTFSKHVDDFSQETAFDNEGKPCTQTDQMIINLETDLTKDSYEFLKIFGVHRQVKLGTRTFVKIKGKKFNIEYFEGSRNLKYKIITKNKNERINLRNRLIRQINKYLNCIKCAACVGLCSKGAIEVTGEKFKIDSKKCINCLRCTSGELLKMGCVAIHYKPDRLLIDRKVKTSSSKESQYSMVEEESQISGIKTP